MDETNNLLKKIVDTIQRDVNSIFVKTNDGVLQPEHQEALTRYYKILNDSKTEALQRQLESQIKRAEEALNRGSAVETRTNTK